ncbi:MAG: hemerythrin domain-containing protein [Holophagaceae bacterium]|nr:hemerythrin domain-containing protein [Holophagaceae bacterium]
MSFLQWQEGYETGYAAYDNQHQTLFRLANRLQEILDHPGSGTGQDIAPVYVAFLELTKAHVRTEDELMRWAGYATADDHDTAHMHFLELLVSAQDTNDLRPMLRIALQKFKAHFESQDEQAFLALLRTRHYPPTAS